eukprot:14352390-Ditylum_brightwellii.AAC.1
MADQDELDTKSCSINTTNCDIIPRSIHHDQNISLSPIPPTIQSSSDALHSPPSQQDNPGKKALPCLYCQSIKKKQQHRGKTTLVPPPSLPPEAWPQDHLLLRPTPGSGTKVTGVRFVGTDHYLWKSPNQKEDASTVPWWESLSDFWNNSSTSDSNRSQKEIPSSVSLTPLASQCCPECAILPINNGREARNKTLVVDFTSNYFVGTLLLRIRNSIGTTKDTATATDGNKCHSQEEEEGAPKGYFEGATRKYQAVIHGQFKSRPDDESNQMRNEDDDNSDNSEGRSKNIPMMQCVTGLILQRPLGKLPPSWLVRGAEKMMKIFAPKLQLRSGGTHPGAISPLGSTPQVICAQKKKHEYGNDAHLEDPLEEPSDAT